MNDPAIVNHAPNMARLLSASVTTSLDADVLIDRGRGAMLGLAAGNLLGLPVEGYWYYEIAARYPNGLTEIDLREAHRSMDDDLAQAVELGEALVGGDDYIQDFAARLIIWLEENGRGCGHTTREVIYELRTGNLPPEPARIVYERNGRIAPNGGVMRCAPVAIARRDNPELLVSDSAATCVVTHYAPTCQWSCIIINATIAILLNGATPDLGSLYTAAIADGCPDLAAIAHADGIPADVLDAIADGQQPPRDMSWLLCNHNLIGHTLLAMEVGLWAATTPLNFEDALIASVSVGGDTDTSAAVAGAVLGARYGASAIPQRWRECFPEPRRIRGLADNLLALGEG